MANVLATSGPADRKNDVEMSESSEKESHTKHDDDEKLCPLFMEGLPSDFSTNAGLAAIASLLDEDPVEVVTKKIDHEAPPIKSGGGKLRRTPMRSRRKEGRPYKARGNEGATKKASVGEAHLFLKMWKL